MDKDVLPVLILVVLVFIVGFVFMKSQTSKQQSAEVPQTEKGANQTSGDKNKKVLGSQDNPKITKIDTSKQYTALLNTSEGTIKVELNAKQTPKTVDNFVTLARKKFYDGTIFHRVIKGFMIQGGDPNGDGTGGPGYKFDDEPFEGEYTRGTMAMANAGPNTNGSQFFIMHKDYALPKNYVIFGKVIEGIEIVDKIAEAPTEMSANGEPSKPVTPVKVTSVEIQEQ